MRPAKFVAGDELVFLKNTQAFTERTGCEVRIEMQAWEDLRPKTAVAANVGAGPDIALAWLDDPHQYPDKLLDLTDIATYLGEAYGGWFPVCETYGKAQDGRWIAMPVGAGGGTTGPDTPAGGIGAGLDQSAARDPDRGATAYSAPAG